MDFDFDNDVDATDATRLAELDSTTTYRQPGQPSSGIGNTRAHQGLSYDAEIGSYNNRTRQYAPQLKRFMQRDPLALRHRAPSGYQDGMNLYQYIGASPPNRLDPSGMYEYRGCYACTRTIAGVTRVPFFGWCLYTTCNVNCTLSQCYTYDLDMAPTCPGTVTGTSKIICDCSATACSKGNGNWICTPPASGKSTLSGCVKVTGTGPGSPCPPS